MRPAQRSFRLFFGQADTQIPQPTQLSASSFHVLAARSTVIASCGHFFAQSVQKTQVDVSLTGLPPAWATTG